MTNPNYRKYIKIHDMLIDACRAEGLSNICIIEFLMTTLSASIALERFDDEALTDTVHYFHHAVANAVEKVREMDKPKTPPPTPEPEPTPEQEEKAYQLAMETLQKMTGK